MPADQPDVFAPSQDPIDLIQSIREEDETTEPADDNPMDEDEDAIPLSRKRERAASKPASKLETRSSKASTPVPTKRMRLQTSTVRSISASPTRIFALWKKTSKYYPAIVYSHTQNSTRFKVHFDDGDEAVLDITQMRRCELHLDDEIVPNTPHTDAAIATVIDLSELENNRVLVRSVNSEPEDITLKLQEISITTRTIGSQWKDRTLRVEEIVTKVKSTTLNDTPTPSRTSVSGTRGTAKILSNAGFAVSLSPDCQTADRRKDEIYKAIKASGGRILENWCEVLHTGGKMIDNKRWVLTQSDVVYKPKARVERAFMLSDDCNQKPKYLEALALGIPCLDVKWLDELDETVSHLLKIYVPACYTDSLYRMSSVGIVTYCLPDTQMLCIPNPHKSLTCTGATATLTWQRFKATLSP